VAYIGVLSRCSEGYVEASDRTRDIQKSRSYQTGAGKTARVMGGLAMRYKVIRITGYYTPFTRNVGVVEDAARVESERVDFELDLEIDGIADGDVEDSRDETNPRAGGSG